MLNILSERVLIAELQKQTAGLGLTVREDGQHGLSGPATAAAERGFRVSSRMASNPARFRPACSHCNNGPAPTPICFTVMPGTPKELPRASGSLATFVFFTILCIHDAHARLFQ